MPLGQIPRGGTTKSHGSLVHVDLTSEELPDGFPQRRNHLHTQSASDSSARFPDFHILVPASSCQPFILVLGGAVKLYFAVVFICISFIANDAEQIALFMDHLDRFLRIVCSMK